MWNEACEVYSPNAEKKYEEIKKKNDELRQAMRLLIENGYTVDKIFNEEYWRKPNDTCEEGYNQCLGVDCLTCVKYKL